MSFPVDESVSWGLPQDSGDIVKDALKKEQVIKFVRPLIPMCTLSDHLYRDILAAQEDLRGWSLFPIRNSSLAD
jgi:hypothetical protein